MSRRARVRNLFTIVVVALALAVLALDILIIPNWRYP